MQQGPGTPSFWCTLLPSSAHTHARARTQSTQGRLNRRVFFFGRDTPGGRLPGSGLGPSPPVYAPKGARAIKAMISLPSSTQKPPKRPITFEYSVTWKLGEIYFGEGGLNKKKERSRVDHHRRRVRSTFRSGSLAPHDVTFVGTRVPGKRKNHPLCPRRP